MSVLRDQCDATHGYKPGTVISICAVKTGILYTGSVVCLDKYLWGCAVVVVHG